MACKRLSDTRIVKLLYRMIKLFDRVVKVTVDFDYVMKGLEALSERTLFTFMVDNDDPRWKKLPASDAKTKVDPNLRVEHFPVKSSGKVEVTVELRTLHDNESYREILLICDMIMVDRATSETFMDLYADKYVQKGHFITPCGKVVGEGIDKEVPRIIIDSAGVRHYGLCPVNTDLSTGYQYLVVRSSKRIKKEG